MSPFFFALLHASLGDAEATVRSLEQAYEKRTGWLVYLGAEPAFAALHGQPAFKDLRRHVRAGPRREGTP